MAKEHGHVPEVRDTGPAAYKRLEENSFKLVYRSQNRNEVQPAPLDTHPLEGRRSLSALDMRLDLNILSLTDTLRPKPKPRLLCRPSEVH